MSLISYNALRTLVDLDVITAKEENINGASIDILLDNTIMIECQNAIKTLNTSKNVYLAEKQNLDLLAVHYEDGENIYIEPGQFFLASSKEYFNLPNNIAAEYKLKSSLARNGLQHLLAGWCDPGWTNSKLTLEFKNVSKSTLVIQPGMKIGQMIFWYCEKVPDDHAYHSKGRYNNQHKVQPGKGVI